MKYALVQFIRYNSDDSEAAELNFPQLDTYAALVEQFKLELRCNEKLPVWDVLDCKLGDGVLTLLVMFTHNHDTPRELSADIQHGYDEHGMTGFYRILNLDYTDKDSYKVGKRHKALALAFAILDSFKEAENLYADYQREEKFTAEDYDDMLAILQSVVIENG